jgi:hypothetical protein
MSHSCYPLVKEIKDACHNCKQRYIRGMFTTKELKDVMQRLQLRQSTGRERIEEVRPRISRMD